MSDTIKGASLDADAQLTAAVGAEATLAGNVQQGPVIINDYVIDLQEVSEGVQLTVRKGSEEQTVLIPMGGSGGASHWDELEGKPTGTEGQIVGFDAEGNMVAQNGVATDDTLAVSGAAADAKVVGDRFTEVNGSMESVAMIASLAMPGSLKWDGIIGDRAYVSVMSEADYMVAYVHMSDVTLDIPSPDFITGTMSVCEMGMTAVFPVTPMAMAEDGLLMIGEGVFYVPRDDYSLEGITFPKKGFYFMAYSALPSGIDLSMMYISALSITGLSFPESGGGGGEYFETVEKTSVTEFRDTLTWDGNIGDRYTVTFSNDVGTFCYVHLSDSVPTYEELTADNVSSTLTNGLGIATASPSPLVTQRGPYTQVDFLYEIFNIGESLVVFHNAGISVEGITFEKAGIYVMTTPSGSAYSFSLTIPGYNFTQKVTESREVIKHEHLPEALQFGEVESPSDTLTWDGDTGGREVLGTELKLYKVSDVVLSLTDGANGGKFVVIGNTMEEHEFTAEHVKMPIDGVVIISKESLVCQSISAVVASQNGLTAGTYFAWDEDAYVSSLTFNGYTGFTTTTVKSMDEAYLPESVESVVVRSSTEGSTKKFRITVDDTGTISATEVT